MADASMHRHALWIARAMARTGLSPLHPSDVSRLEAICSVRTVPAGTLLLPAGKAVDRILVVRRGEISLATRRSVGTRRVVVGLVRQGDVVGDIPMLCERPMPFDALAQGECVVIELDRNDLLELLRTSPTFALRWTVSVAKRLEHSQRRILSLLTHDLTEQVAALLLDERERDAGGQWVVRLSHATLAQLLGARRPSVSRVLKDLRRRGLVRGGYRTLVLPDPAGLAAVAGEPLEPDAGTPLLEVP